MSQEVLPKMTIVEWTNEGIIGQIKTRKLPIASLDMLKDDGLCVREKNESYIHYCNRDYCSFWVYPNGCVLWTSYHQTVKENFEYVAQLLRKYHLI
jgi:hypothetical protein